MHVYQDIFQKYCQTVQPFHGQTLKDWQTHGSHGWAGAGATSPRMTASPLRLVGRELGDRAPSSVKKRKTKHGKSKHVISATERVGKGRAGTPLNNKKENNRTLTMEYAFVWPETREET